MPSKKPLQIGKIGSVIGMKFVKGGQAEIIMDAGDVFSIMQKIYENDKKNPSLDKAFKSLEKKYFGSIKLVQFDAQIAAKGVKFTPVIIEHKS